MASLLGMPMVEHCFHRARLAYGTPQVYVATCDRVIFEHILGLGGNAIMTGSHHLRATTRTAEALEILRRTRGQRPDIVVMIQGDEPLIPPTALQTIRRPFQDPSVEIVNLMSRIRSLGSLLDRNNVKVVTDKIHNALYFSREAIPSPWKGWGLIPCYLQTGIIAFRAGTLKKLGAMAETPLERVESVDMNRVLESGGRIRMIPIQATTFGIDTRKDLAQAEKILLKDPHTRLYLAK